MRATTILSMAIGLSFLPASLPAAQKPEKRRTIEVAICLDTSNSMDGLIDSAKIQLWAIVNDLAKIEPTPTLRVGLYQFGNDGIPKSTGWIRKEVDLTSDLDELYKHLNGLRTQGGTEYATRVALQAMKDLKWSQEADALKIVFVCGNEAADQDPQTSYEMVGKLAKSQGILVNTIFCGPANSSEAIGWKQLATLANGKYSNIDQNQAAKAIVIKTPHDEPLLKLGQKLNQTYVAYGKQGLEKAQNQAMQDANALKAAPAGAQSFASALARTSTKASSLYNNSGW
ncbi:MAG: vWA domain-containing protein, partial [Gemmataceae bacterium]